MLQRLAPVEALEFAAELASIAAAMWLVLAFKPALPYQPIFLLLFPVIWMAVRHGLARATLGVLVVNVGVIAAAHITHPDPEALPRRQLVMLALALTGLCLGAVESERRQAEEALRKSEERWRAVFENSAVGIAMCDVAGNRFNAANLAFQKMIGYSEEELRALSFMDVTHDDDHEANRRLSIELLEGKRHSFELGKRYWRKDGGLVWANLHVTLVAGQERTPQVFVAIVEEVTERKLAEEALRLSEEKFARAFHASPAGLSISTLSDGCLLEVNDTFLRLFEYDRDEVIGRSALDLNLWVDRDDRSRMLDDLREHGRVTNQERTHRTSSGRIFTVLHSADTIEVRGVQCLLATFVDITQAKEAQQALQASEQRYRDFISHSNEGVWRVELERPLPADLPEPAVTEWLVKHAYLAECNLAHAHNLGFSTPEEIVGRRLGDLQSALDEEGLELFRAGAGGGFQSRTVEFRLDKDGNTRYLLGTEVPILENGKLVRVWGITRDLTDLKRAEEALRESDARLRLVVSQLPAIVWSTDKAMRFSSHMGAGLRALGLKANQLLGTPVDQFVSSFGVQPVPPDSRRALQGES
ncbi:MAG TPA: PAS domain S-box protein, partial [Terriglobia bacterium]